MKNLPNNLTLEKNLVHASTPWIVLLDVTLTDTDNSAGATVLRFAANNENVTFGGNVYTALPFEASLINVNAQGKIPTVNLRVLNITRVLTPYLNSLDGGLNSTVKMTLINTGHLGEDYSELELEFEVLGCEVNAYWVSWTLGMANPLNQRFPLYRFLANHCNWEFEGLECGYVAGSGETIYTTCDRTLTQCIQRTQQVNFGSFIGMNNDSIRIA